jgi:hypothetical protein
MGIDFEDVSFRINEHFGVRLEVEDVADVCRENDFDCTAGQLHDIICEKCRRRGIPVPISSWTRIRLVLASTLSRRVKEVKRDAWLRRELGFD